MLNYNKVNHERVDTAKVFKKATREWGSIVEEELT